VTRWAWLAGVLVGATCSGSLAAEPLAQLLPEAPAVSATSSQPSLTLPGISASVVEPVPLSGTATGLPISPSVSSTTQPEPTLKLSGNRTTTLRYQHYSSLAPQATGFFQSGFTRHETTRLKVSGQALETVKIEGELYQSDVDFDNRYSLKLATRNYELFLGEFPASFEGSEFTLFQRSLQGAKLTGEVPLSDNPAPKIDFTAIASSPRGETKYEKFFGTDTQGPYQLGGFPVVLESERILVDKVPQVRNADYEINYITGTITFKKRVVERRSLIEATYEARSTLYPRALYGGQVGYHPTDTDSVSLSAVDERDSKDGLAYATSGVPATAHTVLGTVVNHDGEFLRVGGEYGLSLFDPNEFVSGGEHGNAYKGSFEVERFGVTLGGDVKRIEPRYRTLGNTALGSDFLGWSGHGGLGIGKLLSLTGQHNQQRTILNGSPDRTVSTDAKAAFTPSGWPRESYRYYQSRETFQANFDKVERRHTADISHEMKHLTVGGGYEREELSYPDGSQPGRTWDAGKANLGLKGYSWLTAALNGEMRTGRQTATVYSASSRYQSQLAGVNLGFTPHERYSLTADNHWQRTTGQPDQNTVRTSAKAKPVDQVSTEGSYSQETLQMPFVGVNHAAHTDSYGALVDVQPVRSLSFLYQPTLRETLLSGIRTAPNVNRKDQYTAKWALGSVLSAEGGYSEERYRLRDTTDPGLRVLTRQDSKAWNTSLRLAPVTAFSSDITYTDNITSKAQLNLMSPTFQDTRGTREQTAHVGLKPQLESKLGIDAGYRFSRFFQGGSQGNATSLPAYQISPLGQQITSFSLQNDYRTIHTYEHAVDGGLSYQWNKAFITNGTLAYDLKQDRLHLIPNVETLSVGAGLTFRVKWMKAEGTCRLARSRGRAGTFQQAFSGGLDILPASQIRWTNRVEYTLSRRPSSAATDATSSLEMSF